MKNKTIRVRNSVENTPNTGDDLKTTAPLKRRKIKIRLADPNVPNSYVCEIYDTSLDSEDELTSNECLQSKQNQNNGTKEAEEDPKPKNYFEIMMSKNGRKSFNNSSVKENEDVMVSPDKNIKGTSKRNKANGKRQPQLICSEGKKGSNSSSDDESLFTLSRLWSGSSKSKTESSGDVQFVKELKGSEESGDQVCELVNSNQVEVPSKKKNLNLLNYFSKVETTSENKSVKSSQPLEVDEICIIEESSKPCGETRNLKIVSSESSKKLFGQNGKGKSFSFQSFTVNNGSFKLAPLFRKKEKNFLSVTAQKERFEFLHSGMPTLSKKVESNKTECSCIFPTVSHIQQRDDSSYWHRRKVILPFSELGYSDEYKMLKSDKKFNFSIIKSDTVNSVVSERVEINKEFLNNLKCKYADLNFDVIFDGLKKKRDKYISLTKELEKSRTSRNKCQLLSDDQGFEVFNTLWIDKYKPSSSEILGNKCVVQKLRRWLESWKVFDEQLKSLMKSGGKLQNREGSEDSVDDDFLESDEERYGLESPGNICLLSGPNGCGKTTLISALANELEFNVLEVNASSKRTGKKVLSDLQEATQSHKVHHSNPFQPHVSVKKGKKKRGGKQNKKKDANGLKRIQDQTNDCKISLILIEDADIVFEEHDEGFIPAIASLVQTSKRPIIFLANEPQCPYLDSLKTNRCLVLEMERPCFYTSCALLDVVSSLEGVPLKRETLEFLVRSNGFDLRKSLLELQFWVQSGDNSVNVFQNYDLGQLWWGLSKFLYRREINRLIRPKRFKRKRSEDLFDSSDEEEIATKKFKLNSDKLINATNHKTIPKKRDPIIHSYFNILDLTSTLDRFKLTSNCEPIPGINYSPKDSLSLEENMEGGFWCEKNLTERLFSELISLSSQVFTEKCKRNEEGERRIDFVPPSWEELLWRKSREEASKEISVLVPLSNGREKKSVYLDYLPTIRNICRQEKNRLTVNSKRKNRFYHYLSNLGVEFTDENLDINCDVFKY